MLLTEMVTVIYAATFRRVDGCFAVFGSTHALLMDAGVLDCVLEFICEDFKHFEEHAADRADGEAADERVSFTLSSHSRREW